MQPSSRKQADSQACSDTEGTLARQSDFARAPSDHLQHAPASDISIERMYIRMRRWVGDVHVRERDNMPNLRSACICCGFLYALIPASQQIPPTARVCEVNVCEGRVRGSYSAILLLRSPL